MRKRKTMILSVLLSTAMTISMASPVLADSSAGNVSASESQTQTVEQASVSAAAETTGGTSTAQTAEGSGASTSQASETAQAAAETTGNASGQSTSGTSEDGDGTVSADAENGNADADDSDSAEADRAGTAAGIAGSASTSGTDSVTEEAVDSGSAKETELSTGDVSGMAVEDAVSASTMSDGTTTSAEDDGTAAEEADSATAKAALDASSADSTEDAEPVEWTSNGTKVKMFSPKVTTTTTGDACVLTISARGYSKVFVGSVTEAAAADDSARISAAGGVLTISDFTEDQTSITLAFYSDTYNTWKDRTFTFDWSTHTFGVTTEGTEAVDKEIKTSSDTFTAVDTDGNSLDDAVITVTDASGRAVKDSSGSESGVSGSAFVLTAGEHYTVKATKKGYQDATISYQAKTKSETKSLTLAEANVIAGDMENTDLADGSYTVGSVEKTGGMHSTVDVTVEDLEVSAGKAYATIVWKSSSQVSHFFLGEVVSRKDDASLYDPDTGKIGTDYAAYCYAATSTQAGGSWVSSARIPVQLGKAFTLSVRYPDAMGTPYWASYTVTITAGEREAEGPAVRATSFRATGTDGSVIRNAVFTVKASDGSTVTASSDGSYSLETGKTYTVTAKADGYQTAVKSITVPADNSSTDPAVETIEMQAVSASEKILTVTNKFSMFYVVSASIVSSGETEILRVVLRGKGYGYLYRGSTSEAATADTSSLIGHTINSDGRYVYDIPITAKDGTISVSARSTKNGKWYSRKMTLDQTAGTLLVENGSDSAAEDQVTRKTDGYIQSDQSTNKGNGESTTADTQGESTAAGSSNDAQTGGTAGTTSGSSKIGKYTFSWSGGSGRAKISCLDVFEKGGQLYAVIHFSQADGGVSSYTQVRSLGQTVSGSNTFTIPVNKNANTSIQALTTAMSAGHWISYTIYVGTSDNAGTTSGISTLTDNTTTFDTEAPEITGLETHGEIEVKYSDLFRIFRYENEDGETAYLIEVDMVTDTARDEDEEARTETAESVESTEDEYDEAADSTAVEDSTTGDGTTEDNTTEDNTTEDGEVSDAEMRRETDVYEQNIVKYLVIPEDMDVPAGLEKEVIVIREPVSDAYVASEEALSMIDELGADDCVGLVGMEKNDVTVESIRERMTDDADAEENNSTQDEETDSTETDNEENSDAVVFAGTYDDWDLKTLLQGEADVAILSADFLPHVEDNAVAFEEEYSRRIDEAVQLQMPLFVDRSKDETNDLAKAEWYRVYGILSGQAEAGQEKYDDIVGSATAEEKQAALAALVETGAEASDD